MSVPAKKHVIRWYARVAPCAEAPDGYLPRTRSMVESSFGWDARCSCGWETRSGGFIANRIREEIADHKFDVEHS